MSFIEGDVLCEPLPPDREPIRNVHAVRDAQPSKAFSTLVRKPVAARLEIDDVAYHRGSALTLPVMPSLSPPEEEEEWSFLDEEWAAALKASAPEHYAIVMEPPSGGETETPPLGRSTLALAAIVLLIAKQNPSLRLLVAGHAEKEEASDPDALSAARAKNFLAIVQGDRESFVASTKGFGSNDDLATIGSFLATTFGWPWTEKAGQDAATAMSLLRTSYNAAAAGKSVKPFFAKTLATEGEQVTDDDLGAVYDCCNLALAVLLNAGTPEELTKIRASLQFADGENASSGYGIAVERDSRLVWRSKGARRVEALFLHEDSLKALSSRGVERVFDPDLFDFVQLDPQWFQRHVPMEVEEGPELGEPKKAGSIEVTVTLRNRPEGLAYIDDLLEHHPGWPGEKSEWQPPSESL